MSDFGPCKFCAEPAMVKFNQTPVCMAHYDDMLREARALIDRAIALSQDDEP